MTGTFGITDLAHEFGITPRAIRFYEDQGLLTPVREGQRRVYGSRDRVRLKLIMRGKRLGFSLIEIREILDLYDAESNGETAQLRHFLSKIRQRRAQLRQQQEDIAAILEELDALESQCAGILTGRGERT
ncbi:MAG: MerR family DNA-binding transcriptional regulator [Alphaproteobacteria bacterium]|nr:MerR family DNA-binding transcriptional regulator [Alphaproteobacteria bacterium]MBF0391784.1 MerR family DNA-binding transcriptional regulator [Alphaproteobacteria bacterium]